MSGQNASIGRESSFLRRILLLSGMMLTMFAATAWMAHRIWQQALAARTSFQTVHRVSTWLGHQISDEVHQLDSRMLRYKLGIGPAEWQQFQTEVESLKEWVAGQRSYLTSPDEKQLLRQIDDEIEGYAAAARRFADASDPVPVSDTVANEVTELSHRSKALVELAFELANAHQATVDDVLATNDRKFTQIQRSMYVALGFMLCVGTGMGVVVYRDSIAPLRLRLRESQTKLARQEKLAALGEMAAAIAHEIRNPLTAVKARLFTLRKSIQTLDAATEDATMINNEIDRLERIVRDFLRFARPPEPEPGRVDPLALLHKVRDLVGPECAAAEVTVLVDETPAPAMEADADQIIQALLNVVQNSTQAIAATGRPGTVRLSSAPQRNATPGNRRAWVRIDIADDGPGMTPETRHRLFDPFFTTKPNGTGLGLALTARILEKHGGRIECRSEPNHGATFTFILPKAA